MIEPPRWSTEELAQNLSESARNFREQRMSEPLEVYLEAFDDYQGNVEDLFETTVDLGSLDSGALDALTDTKLLDAFRYLAGPPISDDDLKTLADVRTLNPTQLRKDPELIRRIVQGSWKGSIEGAFPGSRKAGRLRKQNGMPPSWHRPRSWLLNGPEQAVAAKAKEFRKVAWKEH